MQRSTAPSGSEVSRIPTSSRSRTRRVGGSGGGLATVLEFRPRPEPAPVELLGWHDAHRFERGARYREQPTGRTGYFIGVSEVPPLTAMDLSPLVLLFRDPETGVMWICSESEAAVGVAYEPLTWDQ